MTNLGLAPVHFLLKNIIKITNILLAGSPICSPMSRNIRAANGKATAEEVPKIYKKKKCLIVSILGLRHVPICSMSSSGKRKQDMGSETCQKAKSSRHSL